MSLFKRIADGLTDGLDRAQWEADKLVKVNRIRGQISDLERELSSAQARLANKVLELHADGRLQVPELDEPIWGIADIDARLDEMREDLTSASAMRFEDAQVAQKQAQPKQPRAEEVQAEEGKPDGPQLAEQPVATEGAPPPTSSEAAPGARFCASCGTSLQQDARFCPECGQKVD